MLDPTKSSVELEQLLSRFKEEKVNKKRVILNDDGDK